MKTTTDSKRNASASEVPQPKMKRMPAKNSKSRRKRGVPGSQPANARRTAPTRRPKVIALMKRAKSATLAEIIAATEWQAHTVRGFVGILGSNGGKKIDSSKNAAGERTYKIGIKLQARRRPKTPPRLCARSGVSAFTCELSDVRTHCVTGFEGADHPGAGMFGGCSVRRQLLFPVRHRIPFPRG
jgi:Protein of unknown function (DUF3489)